jgi:aryl-alcohol dehydrogenase-like predicted oxidoreductase
MMPVTISREKLGKSDLVVSRLGLGTAEIGFAYGLGSPALPSEAEALALLGEAVELGVTFFDTANYYGVAEDRLGKSGILKDPAVAVCTKCAQFLEKGEYFAPPELEAKIREQVEGSLRALRLETLSILMLHGPSKEQVEEGVLIEIMKKLRQEGKVRYWGASTRGEEAPLALIDAGADVLQVAFSVADRRMAPCVFEAARAKGVGIINRSIYLKGVFAGKDALLPPALAPLRRVVEEAATVASELGISLRELAVRYTLSEPAIATSLIGTAKIAHLAEAAESLAHGPLPNDAVEKLRALALTDPDQIDPARWPK